MILLISSQAYCDQDGEKWTSEPLLEALLGLNIGGTLPEAIGKRAEKR